MALITYSARADIPEELAEFVKEADGKFTVDVGPKAKINEFRDNNIALKQERDALKEKLTKYSSLGDDPTKLTDELRVLREVDQLVKDGKLKGTDAISAEVEKRLKEARDGYEAQIRDLTNKVGAADQKAAQADQRWRGSVLDQRITNAVLAEDSNVNPATLPDVLARARGLYTVTDDGKLVPKQGDTVVYGSDGEPMQPKEWLTKVLADAPYLGKASAGGGADGGAGGKELGGLSQEAFSKLSPEERITRFRAAQGGRR